MDGTATAEVLVAAENCRQRIEAAQAGAATPDTADPPESARNSRTPSDVLACIDRLKSLCPEAFKEAERRLVADGFWPAVVETIERQVSAKGYSLLADILEFAEAWTPTADGTRTATTDTEPQHDADAGTDADQLPKHRRAQIGKLMPINHFFTGWAENVKNVQAMLEAVSCFTNGEERFTAISEDDGRVIEQMVGFVDRELDVLVERLNMAGDYDNPRVVTDGGWVWGLNTTATLIETPCETEGGAE